MAQVVSFRAVRKINFAIREVFPTIVGLGPTLTAAYSSPLKVRREPNSMPQKSLLIHACSATTLLCGWIVAETAWSQDAADRQVNAEPLRMVRIHSAPLPPSERLVISFSKSTDRFGKTRQVLVFFGRVDDRGWEAIGNGNVGELQDHWRRAAERSFGDFRKLELSEAEHQKIDLAIEFTIAEFIRMYQGLQYELDSHNYDPVELSTDARFKQLRELGAMGLFHSDSLAVRVANRIAARATE